MKNLSLDPKRIICIVLGPALYASSMIFLASTLTGPGAEAIGLLAWMVFWWVTRPVHMTVTALLPLVVNAIFGIVEQDAVTSQYFSDSIILILGTFLLTTPWKLTGFDRRVALKILSLVGPSITSQIMVWMCASVALSTVLPNVAVTALFTPIAVAMLNAAGYKDMSKCAAAAPILLCVGWGAGLGGAGTPLGGAMNVTAISLLQEHLGREIMYIDYVVRIAPYVILVTLASVAIIVLMHKNVPNIEGTKGYFAEQYRELGPISRDEAIAGGMFLIGLIGAFARPLYASILPALAPAYVLVGLGIVMFFITRTDGSPMITWQQAQDATMWGMMVLFGGGLALGKIINLSGATTAIAGIVSSMSFDGGFTTILMFAIIAIFFSEVTSSTVSAAVVVPILLSFTTQMGLNPIPYWLALVMAYNGQFLLPISVMSIPISYGVDASVMLKRGTVVLVIKLICAVGVGYLSMLFWPGFGVM